jgi:hypothetical protein
MVLVPLILALEINQMYYPFFLAHMEGAVSYAGEAGTSQTWDALTTWGHGLPPLKRCLDIATRRRSPVRQGFGPWLPADARPWRIPAEDGSRSVQDGRSLNEIECGQDWGNVFPCARGSGLELRRLGLEGCGRRDVMSRCLDSLLSLREVGDIIRTRETACKRLPEDVVKVPAP